MFRHKNKFSRVKQRDKHRVHINKTGVALLCALALGFFGIKGAGIYKQHMTKVHQIERIQRYNANHITCQIKAMPNSEILINGQAKGHANKQGIYKISRMPLGSSIQSIQNSTRSDILKLGSSARNRTMTLNYDYLSNSDAQSLIRDVYKQVTLLTNQGPDVENTLASYYEHGSDNDSYQDMLQWCTNKYHDIKDTQKESENNKKSEGKSLSSVHFAVSVRRVTLNSDGTVTLRYNTKNYLDRESGTDVHTVDWISHAKQINGTWYIIDSSAKSA